MDGYEEACKLDKLIAQLQKENPITTENGDEWLSFSRALKATSEVMERWACEKISQATGLLAAKEQKNRQGFANSN